MSLTRKVRDTPTPRSDRKPVKPVGRRIIMTFEVETHLYPAEICEPTRVALELAGISVISCHADWAKAGT